eukprot:TRINITY_DN34284_c0_g1_i1.p1 TRINITY_DN34284_c0_g1~~TRINITY_DN34284_c0_g1_i1.p1  ORF type:complete len:785 (-),score=183.42 TRINITY_DN34284_c0_g1_i1:66-2099(-)
MAERVLLVAADQRGSKPLERLLRKASSDSFNEAFKRLIAALPELAPNQYGSHVLQSALASWAERLGEDEPARPPVAPLVTICKSLREDGGWPALVVNPCASHVIRALLLALGGYVTDAQGKSKAAAKAGLLPEKRVDVPPEVAESRRFSAASLVALLREDETLCLSAHASPVIQLLLRILRDSGDRSLLAEACTAVVGAPSATGAPSVDRCDALLHSAAGSRSLEAAIETASQELFAELFSRYFRPRLKALCSADSAEFGPFLVQRLVDGIFHEPQLQLALAELDFTALLGDDAGPSQHVIVLKLLEAALRLKTGFRQVAIPIFRALALQAASEHHRSWPTILCLEQLGFESLWKPASGRKQHGKAAELKDTTGLDETLKASSQPLQIRNMPSAGPQILAALLRFPGDAVTPILAGLPKLLEQRELLVALAQGARTAKVLEAALSPSSALNSKQRLRMVKAFKGCLACLGPHHVGGWVCAAVWRASLAEPSLREAFAKELLEVEEELRSQNFAVWKVCGLHQAKVRNEEWTKAQHKAGKTQRLFGELLEGGAPEAVKAPAVVGSSQDRDKLKAAVLADPTVAALLPMADDTDDKLEQSEEDGGDASEVDGLLSSRPKRRRKLAKAGTGIKKAELKSPSVASSSGKGDASLMEALKLLKSRASGRARKKRKRSDIAAS